MYNKVLRCPNTKINMVLDKLPFLITKQEGKGL